MFDANTAPNSECGRVKITFMAVYYNTQFGIGKGYKDNSTKDHRLNI